MKLWMKAVAGCWLALGAATALALDCGVASSPIEKTVCREADLRSLDADLNRLYTGLRPQLSAKARTLLLDQQRAWLAERDKDCATGEATCLRKQYSFRVEQLQALKASADASDGPLNDVTPVIIKGSWKVTAIHDPAGGGRTDEKALRQALSNAGLPAVGTTVNAAPGNLCFLPQPCGPMAWTRKAVADVNGSASIRRSLGLGPTVPVLAGSSGSKWSYYLLVPQSDGTLWATFGLCGPGEDNCRNAAEVWTPVNADATVWWPPS